MHPVMIETSEDYELAQLRVLELGRPLPDSAEEHEQIALGKAMVEWELRSAGVQDS